MTRQRRKYLRATSVIEVWMGEGGIFHHKDERIVVLGGGGALIRTRRQYNVGRMLMMRFRLTEVDDYITVSAVIRSVQPTAMGVEFVDLSWEDRQCIKAFVESQLLSDVLQKTVRRVTGNLTPPPVDALNRLAGGCEPAPLPPTA